MAGTSLQKTFSALADPTRCAVVSLLGEKPLRSSEMADELSTSRPLMSRHLRVLREAGLVEEQASASDARVRVYRLRREPLHELRSWLEQVEAFWGDQLAAFKAHAERGDKKRSR